MLGVWLERPPPHHPRDWTQSLSNTPLTPRRADPSSGTEWGPLRNGIAGIAEIAATITKESEPAPIIHWPRGTNRIFWNLVSSAGINQGVMDIRILERL
jgi:hypothetical protein